MTALALPRSALPRPRASVILGGTLLLLWPTLLNWHPYLFWDTYSYFLQGKAYAQLLLGAWGAGPVPPEAMGGWIGAAGRLLADDPSLRSPIYSLLLYALAALGSFWLVALATALPVAAAVEITLVRVFQLDLGRRLLVMLGMAAFSSLPWFASYLMPDVHAGILILALGLLAFSGDRLRAGERLFLILLYMLSLTFHSSHLLLAVALVGVAVALSVDRRAVALRLAVPTGLAILLLVAVNLVAFGQASLTPPGPPFLLARAWGDGPARTLLFERCPDAGWAICKEIHRLNPTAQEFLWGSTDSYWAMDHATRTQVRAEEGEVLKATVLAMPLEQATAAALNFLEQARRFGLKDLVIGRGAVVTPEDYTFLYLPEAPAARHGLEPFERLALAGALTALAAILWLARPGRRRALRSHARGLLVVIALGILLNAAICGILSGPHDRYQARIVWLVPLFGFALLARPRASLLSRSPPVPVAAGPSSPAAGREGRAAARAAQG